MIFALICNSVQFVLLVLQVDFSNDEREENQNNEKEITNFK